MRSLFMSALALLQLNRQKYLRGYTIRLWCQIMANNAFKNGRRKNARRDLAPLWWTVVYCQSERWRHGSAKTLKDRPESVKPI